MSYLLICSGAGHDPCAGLSDGARYGATTLRETWSKGALKLPKNGNSPEYLIVVFAAEDEAFMVAGLRAVAGRRAAPWTQAFPSRTTPSSAR